MRTTRTAEQRVKQLIKLHQMRMRSVKTWPEIEGLKNERTICSQRGTVEAADQKPERAGLQSDGGSVRSHLAAAGRGIYQNLFGADARTQERCKALVKEAAIELFKSLNLLIATVIVIAGSLAALVGSILMVGRWLGEW